MHEVIDNFLSEAEFKVIQEFGILQPCDSGTEAYVHDPVYKRAYPEILSDDSEVIINEPKIQSYIDRNVILLTLKNKLIDIIESKYSIKQITEYGSSIHRHKYGAGILLHKDHSYEINEKRLGISLYLNNVWKPNWGGELIIYNNTKKALSNSEIYVVEKDSCEPIDVILPKRNRLVIIEGSWHKVSPNLNKSVDRVVIQTFITLSLKKNNNKYSETL